MNYGSTGPGSSVHLATGFLKSLTGADLTEIPYRGSAQMSAALLAGEISVVVGSLSGALPHVRAGTERALAVLSDRRSPLLPTVPTAAEAGVPELDVRTWMGLMAPAGTPPEIIERLNGELNRVLHAESTLRWFADRANVATGGTPASFGQTLRSDYARWGEIARKAGVAVR